MRDQGETLLTLPAVKARVGMGKTRIYEAIKTGEFPERIKNGRSSVWVESEIEEWIRRKIASSKQDGRR